MHQAHTAPRQLAAGPLTSSRPFTSPVRIAVGSVKVTPPSTCRWARRGFVHVPERLWGGHKQCRGRYQWGMTAAAAAARLPWRAAHRVLVAPQPEVPVLCGQQGLRYEARGDLGLVYRGHMPRAPLLFLLRAQRHHLEVDGDARRRGGRFPVYAAAGVARAGAAARVPAARPHPRTAHWRGGQRARGGARVACNAICCRSQHCSDWEAAGSESACATATAMQRATSAGSDIQ